MSFQKIRNLKKFFIVQCQVKQLKQQLMSYTRLLINLSSSKLNSDNCNFILDNIITRLTDQYSKPRKILNVLNLIDFLLINGSAKFKGEMEDERYFLKQLKERFNDPYEELSSPINNVIVKIIKLIENPEDLKKEREDAKKIRNRIKGVSNGYTGDDSRFKGVSSDDINQNEYDIRTEINLQKKLGLDNNIKNGDDEQDEVSKEKKDQKVDDIDFLAENNQDENKMQKKEQKQKKKKLFLPPPPKKNKKAQPKYKKNKIDQKKQEENFLNLEIQSDENQQKQQNSNQIFEEINFISNNDTQPNSKQESNPNLQEDFLDLNLVENKNTKKEGNAQDFLNLNSLGKEKHLQNNNIGKLKRQLYELSFRKTIKITKYFKDNKLDQATNQCQL